MNSIGPIYRKIAACGFTLFLLFLAVRFVIFPIGNLFDQRSETIRELELRRDRLAALEQRLSQTTPILREEVSQAEGLDVLLTEPMADLASANLQGRLRSIVTSNGATLRSVRSLQTPDSADPVGPIAARLSIVGNLTSIQSTLYDIETATPYIFIETLKIEPNDRRQSSNSSSLNVEISLVAYRLGGQL